MKKRWGSSNSSYQGIRAYIVGGASHQDKEDKSGYRSIMKAAAADKTDKILQVEGPLRTFLFKRRTLKRNTIHRAQKSVHPTHSVRARGCVQLVVCM